MENISCFKYLRKVVLEQHHWTGKQIIFLFLQIPGTMANTQLVPGSGGEGFWRGSHIVVMILQLPLPSGSGAGGGLGEVDSF